LLPKQHLQALLEELYEALIGDPSDH
jgi:hypothetical protein